MARESWGSRFGFIMAVAGSAIGLANVWRFPYLVGKNGGAAFILVYIFFLALIGFPVLVAEIAIGRKTLLNPSGALKKLGGPLWSSGGKLMILTGFLVSSFYSVVAGWILGYFIEALQGNVSNFTSTTEAQNTFSSLIASPYWGLCFHFLFLLFCAAVLYLGVREGIEKGTKIMMPILFVVLVLLVIKGISLDNSSDAITFLLSPDWSVLTKGAILAALGQAFFTLSLGQGTMITYGSYLSKKESIIKTCLPVILMDLVVSLLAAVAVFTIAFSVGIQPDSGPGLIFHTLPWVFSQLSGGYLIAVAFFLLVLLAAMTSEISALEPFIAYLCDERGFSRHKAVMVAAGGAFLAGIPSALSYGILRGWTIDSMPILDFMDYLCSSILIPIGGFLAVAFVGWRWKVSNAIEEIKVGSLDSFEKHRWLYPYFKISFQFGAPIFIILILMNALGLFG